MSSEDNAGKSSNGFGRMFTVITVVVGASFSLTALIYSTANQLNDRMDEQNRIINQRLDDLGNDWDKKSADAYKELREDMRTMEGYLIDHMEGHDSESDNHRD